MELIARYGGLPETLSVFAETAPMRRLRQVGMHCGCEYTACPLYKGKPAYSRYLHSLGAAAIVWHFTKDEAQSLSALFHDIATPVFAPRCRFSERRPPAAGIDRSADARHSDKRCKASGRPPCPGLQTQDVDDYHRYPIADNDSPRLSSDRLEYTLGKRVPRVRRIA